MAGGDGADVARGSVAPRRQRGRVAGVHVGGGALAEGRYWLEQTLDAYTEPTADRLRALLAYTEILLTQLDRTEGAARSAEASVSTRMAACPRPTAARASPALRTRRPPSGPIATIRCSSRAAAWRTSGTR